ncbi:MAG TPA: immunoglobulin domain-containing protein [Verrucomicrobiae bacterium]|nr:immunoglobulin domain-containing protein [Verrucomicrobiae bacterium]
MNAPRVSSRFPAPVAWISLALVSLLSPISLTCSHAAGTVVAWGDNSSLQSQIPINLTNIVAVAGGVSHSVALKADGTVVAWGNNLSGQTNVPSNLASVAAIAAGATYSMALQSNGNVVLWGSQPAAPSGLGNVTAIAAGWTHSLALKSDRTVVSWGTQTDVPVTLSNVVAIAAGNGQSLALRIDGTVVAWGDNSYGKTNVPAGLSNVIAIAAGGDHCLALKSDSTVVGWGRNDDGQTTIPANLKAVAVSGGALHSLALKTDGTLAAWGDNTYGQTTLNPGDSGYISISAGGYHNLSIKGDGNPFILLQPFSQTVLVTKTATFQVIATGTAPLTYQWQHYGTNIAGATSQGLNLTNVQPADSGPYTVIVRNAYSSTTSSPAILNAVGGAPVVTVPLLDQTAICGDNLSFQVVAGGSAPVAYQWSFQGQPITGATQPSLALTNVTPANAGPYTVLITNAFGSMSTGAVLTVTVQPPSITSSLAASGTQGVSFTYATTALHTPTSFSALFLPAGLSINTNSGVISGIPQENGTFGVVLSAFNACSSDSQTLVLTLAPALPVITSATNATATESSPFSYQIRASNFPTSYGSQNLPTGLLLNPATGLISGIPVFAGTFLSTISASNQWGIGSATLQFTIANVSINSLAIQGLVPIYSSPFLLDFQFALRDNAQNAGIVTKPSLITPTCMELLPNGTVSAPAPNVPTATALITNIVEESGIFIARGNNKVFKSYLVLDFSDSISDPLLNGDSDNDGISDAVDYELAGAKYFVDEQPIGSQMGVYEFHRDDEDPQQVIALTKNKGLLDSAIGGIWTNYVQGFYAGSRCWDALSDAITALGASNPDEQHYIIFVSDGVDYSSTVTSDQVIAMAVAAKVKIDCVAFGANPDLATLGNITAGTIGRLYIAQSPTNLFEEFASASKDIQALYDLRWATLRRGTNSVFDPYFLLSYQGLSAAPDPWTTSGLSTNPVPPVPPSTNMTTNIVISWQNSSLASYDPSKYTGPVTNGTLRLVLDDQVEPSGITLRATYIPRFVRQLRFHYQANWPCTPILDATNSGEMLSSWSMTQSNDVDGSTWLLLSSPNPQDQATSLPFVGFGPLVTFQFNDILSNPSNALALIAVDNSIYTNILAGGQWFSFDTNSLASFVTNYPPLPYGTPVPWLLYYGFSGNLTNAEVADTDGDGMVNWQEYRANTNPTNAASKFYIVGAARGSDGRFQVTFSTSTNRTYRLDSSIDLVSWQTVQDNITGVNTNVTIIDTRYIPNLTNIYYRATVY